MCSCFRIPFVDQYKLTYFSVPILEVPKLWEGLGCSVCLGGEVMGNPQISLQASLHLKNASDHGSTGATMNVVPPFKGVGTKILWLRYHDASVWKLQVYPVVVVPLTFCPVLAYPRWLTIKKMRTMKSISIAFRAAKIVKLVCKNQNNNIKTTETIS